MELHVHCFGAAWLDVVGDDAVGCVVISLDERGRLCVSHLFKEVSQGIASWAFMYSAPSLALAALDMTALSILEMLSTAPLLGGSSTLDEQKKWPPLGFSLWVH